MVQNGLNRQAREVQRECLSLKADVTRFKTEQRNHLSALDDKVARALELIASLVSASEAEAEDDGGAPGGAAPSEKSPPAEAVAASDGLTDVEGSASPAP